MVFSPAHLTMIKDGPAERRKFLDLALCQIRTGYKKLLSDYNRSLAQRNMLLRDIAAGKMSADTLFIWDGNLARAGAKIIISAVPMWMRWKNRFLVFTPVCPAGGSRSAPDCKALLITVIWP